MNYNIITAFSILMIAISVLYLVLFSRNQARFMQYWGFSWIAYSLGLFSLLLFFQTGSDLFLEIRKIIDMFNLLLLLFGTYSFMHRHIPTYWYRFSLYLLLLAAICMIYDFELLSFYLPISVYQLILTIFICRNIFFRWTLPQGERIIATVVFFIWGAGKSVYSIAEIFLDVTSNHFMGEIMMSNIVNFCILTIYITYARSEITMTDTLYKTVIDNSRSTMFYYRTSPDPSFVYVSSSIKELTGYGPEEFYGNPRLMISITTEAYAGEVSEMFDERQSHSGHATIELFNKNGDRIWCEMDCTPVEDEDGSSALVGSLRDVTNLKTAQIEQVNENRRRNILLSYISHELRTPITSIAGFLTAIQDGTLNEPGERDEAMEIITSKTLTLKKLIDDLDQLSKLESNQFTFDFEALTVRDVAESLIDRHLSDLEKEGFSVDVQADMRSMESHWIVLDLERINQVFTNLITNAVKYSGDSRKLFLAFAVNEEEKHFLVSLRDEGIGIPPAQLSHVFDRFYRVDYNSNVEKSGRGLGLTISKEIIEAHHGEIFAESSPGEGTIISFTIPLYQEA